VQPLTVDQRNLIDLTDRFGERGVDALVGNQSLAASVDDLSTFGCNGSARCYGADWQQRTRQQRSCDT